MRSVHLQAKADIWPIVGRRRTSAVHEDLQDAGCFTIYVYSLDSMAHPLNHAERLPMEPVILSALQDEMQASRFPPYARHLLCPSPALHLYINDAHTSAWYLKILVAKEGNDKKDAKETRHLPKNGERPIVPLQNPAPAAESWWVAMAASRSSSAVADRTALTRVGTVLLAGSGSLGCGGWTRK